MRVPTPGRALRLVAGAVALLLAVSVVLFVAVQVLPGDPVTQALGSTYTPERGAQLRAQLGLDAPVAEQYLRWLGGVLRGDFGTSAVTRVPVGPIVAERAGNSVVLAAAAFVLIAVLGVGFGLFAGARPGSGRDRAVSAVTLTLTAVPEFALATVLVAVFAFALGWLPAVSLVAPGSGPLSQPAILVLPVASLALYGGAYTARMVRGIVADIAAGPHVEAARIAGLPEHLVLRRHVLPSAAGSIAQVLALLVPYLVGGALVVETVFAYPGLGALLASAVRARDAVQVEAAGLVLAAVAIAGFLVAELIQDRSCPGRAVPMRPALGRLR
ncbi:ABC transporter permease [Micromonospora sp. CPCC 205371]|nr:ABC transporter permease [Micromonospora sp. CPCC 205371]